MKMRMTQLKTIADIQTGPFGSQLHKEDYVETGTPIVTVEHLGNRVFTEQNLPRVSDSDKARLIKYTLSTGDIVFSRVGSVDRCSYVDKSHDGWMFSGRCLRVRPTELVDSLYLYYYFCLEETKQFVRNIAVGATMPSINTKLLGEVEIALPDLNNQKRIAAVLSSLDDKIENNQKLNDNLEQQAFTIFNNMFPNVSTGNNLIGDLITPQRGKNLLSKDAIPGKIPVVAGGLEPATYHNQSNTVPPVLTISSSGANAGFVNLWNIPVWSSDSSFIDSDMTDDVYFWYVMLKIRQQEIFDAQTGSAQPHIYPKHIAAMPVIDLNPDNITAFNNIVTPLFQTIGKNKQENIKLAEIRDTLLPKLMSGELDISSINL